MELEHDASDEELLALVDAWIDDLARGDFVSAYHRTSHDPGRGWTPDLIRRVIEGYGDPDDPRGMPRGPAPHPRRPFQVTPRATAKGQPHYREVDRHAVPPNAIAMIWHDLPLNGEWSDLTATFRVESKDQDIELTLEEIHVF